MASRPAMRRLVGASALVVAAGVFVGASALLPAGTVSAHAGLENTIPAASSVLEESPDNIVLDFDEPVEAELASIELFDADALPIEVGAPNAAADTSVVLASLPDLDDGIYAVVWRVASVDGHVVDGAFSFTIGSGAAPGGDAAADLVDQVSGGRAPDSAVTFLAKVARLLVFVGLVLLLGTGGLAVTSPEHLGAGRAVRRMVAGGWALAFAGTAAMFGLYGASVVAGSVGDAFSPDVWGRVAGTQTARMTLIRLGLIVVLAGLLLRWSARKAAWWREVAVAAGVGAIITLPAAGHAGALSPKALWVLVDAVHLGSIVLWLGGLALFAVGGRAWLADSDAEPVVRRFSRMATVLVPVIVATGVAQGLKLAGGTDTVTETSWGRTLLVKLSIVSVLVAIGAVSRWLLLDNGPASIRRTVMCEAALGLVVLALTASLVSLPPRPVDSGEVFSATLTQAGLLVDITLTPGHVGSNEVHLVLTPPGGSLQPVVSASGRMSLPNRDIPPSPVTFESSGANHYTGSSTLPFSGDWTLELVIEISPGNTVLLTTTVPIP